MQEYESRKQKLKIRDIRRKNIARASTSGMAKSRRKMLEKIELINKPILDAKSANIEFDFERNTGNDVFHIKI